MRVGLCLLQYDCVLILQEHRHVQGWRFRLLLCDQHQLPTRPSKGQVHAKGTWLVAGVVHRFLIVRQIYHPNVDLEGNVCLNILREDWKPVLNLNSVMVGLQYLFLEPNPDDPLNKGAQLRILLCFHVTDDPHRGSAGDDSEPRPVPGQRKVINEGRLHQGRAVRQRATSLIPLTCVPLSNIALLLSPLLSFIFDDYQHAYTPLP